MSAESDTTAPAPSGATAITPQPSFTLRQFGAVAGVLLLGAVVLAALGVIGHYALPYFFHFLRFEGSYGDSILWHIEHLPKSVSWHWHHSA